VYTNVEKFIRRAETIGFLGENKDRVCTICLVQENIANDFAELECPTRHPYDSIAHLGCNLAKPLVPDARELSSLVLGY
jgi:hypothetical protein